MTVTAQEARREYIGNGTTKTFSFPYQFFEADDLDVWIYDVDGLGHYKILNTDYTVSGTLNPSGGSITFVTAPLATDKVIIINDLDIKQVNHYVNSDDFPAQSHEQALDRLTKICQRLSDRIDRSVRAPDYAPTDQVPDAGTLEELVDQAETAAAGANTSATAAATAAAQSQGYANNSATYAQNSANSATAAATSASNAAASATQAADSATAAQVAEVDWKGPWSAATTYMKNDAVNSGGSSYISKTDNNLNNLPPNATHWDILAQKGSDGAGTGTGDMLGANNLAQGPGGVANVVTARTNLGLKGAAILDVGTTAGTVMAGDDARLAGAAPLASPVFTGDPRAPTPATADNDTSIATTGFVKAQGYGPLTNFQNDNVVLAVNTDFNTVLTPGLYTVQSNVNSPTGDSWWHIFVQCDDFGSGSIYCVQRAVSLTATPPQSFIRSRTGGAGTWSGWTRIADQGMFASAAQYRANVAGLLLTTDQVWAAGISTTLTDGATITPDFGAGFDFYLTLGAAGRTLANPSNPKPGQKGVIYIAQDGTGGRTITTWGSYYRFPAGVKPTLTVAANAIDAVSYHVLNTAYVACWFSADMK